MVLRSELKSSSHCSELLLSQRHTSKSFQRSVQAFSVSQPRLPSPRRRGCTLAVPSMPPRNLSAAFNSLFRPLSTDAQPVMIPLNLCSCFNWSVIEGTISQKVRSFLNALLR